MGTTNGMDLDDPKQPESIVSSQGHKPLPNTIKYLTAASIFYGTFALGCAVNTYGPVITTMQHKYDTDDSGISKTFTILTSCYMVGALAAGFIYNYMNRQLAVIVILSTMAAMMFLTPHCPTLGTFFATAVILGLVSGAYDCAQVVWMMEMMQEKCPPYCQTQHFFYALGTNLAGLIMAPFLDEDEIVEEDGTTVSPEIDDSKLFIPYTIIGILVAIAAAAQVILFIFMRYYPPPPETVEVPAIEKSQESSKTSFKLGTWPLAKLRLVILTACFIGAYQGCEMTTFNFFPKFGQNSDLDLSESSSTYVLTGMTAAFAVGRAVAIVAVFKISTQLILVGNIVLIFIANVLLIGWASNSLAVLWTSSIIFGIGFSSVYASISAYIERYLNFTNFIGSIMVVFGSAVAAIYPLIVGEFIDEKPVVLSYTTFFSIAIMILSFGSLSYLTHKDKTRY